MTILTEEVTEEVIQEAFINWCQFHGKQDRPTHTQAFCDFVDPARQCDLYHMHTEMVTKQIARRIHALAGPNWYVIMKANQDRIDLAHRSWSKEFEVRKRSNIDNFYGR